MVTLTFIYLGKKYKVISQKGDDLLIALDNFLKMNKIKVTQLKSFKLKFSPDSGLITRRIARAMVLALEAGSQ